MSLRKRLHEHYHRELSLRRQIAIRALCSFLLTFGIARGYTYSVHYHLLPLRDVVTPSGLHIHHLFWGILLLIVVGFGALSSRDPRRHLHLAVVYGVALALTLDEFRVMAAAGRRLLVAGRTRERGGGGGGGFRPRAHGRGRAVLAGGRP